MNSRCLRWLKMSLRLKVGLKGPGEMVGWPGKYLDSDSNIPGLQHKTIKTILKKVVKKYQYTYGEESDLTVYRTHV